MQPTGIVSTDGHFTVLRFVSGRSGDDLERLCGFEKGRLKWGYKLLALAEDESIGMDDFELDSSTRWSKGQMRLSDGRIIHAEPLLIERGRDVGQLKRMVVDYFARRGHHTPAKILPNLRHTDGMKYPDAEALGPGLRGGIPQYLLLRRKRFVILSESCQ